MALLSLVWGTQFLAIKMGQLHTPPLLTVAMRYGVLAVVAQLACWLWVRGPTLENLRGQRLAFGVAQAVSMMLLYKAQGLVGVAVAGVLSATTPFLVALLAHVAVPGERLTARTLGAALLGLLGVAFMWAGRGPSSSSLEGTSLGVVLLLGSSMLDAVNKVLAKRLATASVPVPVMLRDMALAVLPTALLASAWMERSAWAATDAAGWGTAVYLGVVGSALASGLYLWLLKRHSINALAYLQFLTACVATVTGLVFGESLGAASGLGVVFILLGLAVRGRQQVLNR
jgi:drug/metabolite transporter (DMT)-like permease